MKTATIVIILALACSRGALAEDEAAQLERLGNPYPVAMDGYCPVTIQVSRKWVKGDPKFGAIHRRRTFLFATADEQETFLSDPDRYTPVLTGYDPIRFLKTGELVDGSPQFALTYRREVYLFVDEDSLKTFFEKPAEYSAEIREAILRRER